MAYREIPHKERVQAVREYLETKKLKEVCEKYNISKATILDDYKYIVDETDELLMLKKNVLRSIKRKIKKSYVFLFRK